MELISTSLPDVRILKPKVHGDHRGFFMEIFRKEVFEDIGVYEEFVQDNLSKSAQGILRGLHYQIRQPQGKLVRVIAGEIYDVAVDMRKSSPHFGKWVGVLLSAENKLGLWVPPGFAHGFYVTSLEAEVFYKCSTYYAPEHERGLLWNDPELGIAWPSKTNVVLSDKDRTAPTLQQAEPFL